MSHIFHRINKNTYEDDLLKKYSNLSFVIFSLLTLTNCSIPGDQDQSNRNTVGNYDFKILFVGNSLTYTNDIPKLIWEIGSHDSVAILYSTLLIPNFSIGDHLDQGKVQSEISTGAYDFVVVQQGPSALPESQEILLRDTKILAALCSASVKTKLALFMVWPEAERSSALDNVIYSYTTAAKETKSILCPAGLAWKIAWQKDAALPLYSSDNFHPSLTGSVLAACTIYGALTGKPNFDFIRLNTMSWYDEMTEERLAIIKQSALQSLSQGE